VGDGPGEGEGSAGAGDGDGGTGSCARSGEAASHDEAARAATVQDVISSRLE
jgi:hypothetical protein